MKGKKWAIEVAMLIATISIVIYPETTEMFQSADTVGIFVTRKNLSKND
jgi:hypothetical protein